MAVRFISKGKGKHRKSFPIKPKRGVSVRSVSLRPSSVAKVNKEQIKLLNRGVPATFSKALNQVVMRAKRDGIPIYDTHVNSNDRRKPYRMWIVKHPEKGDKIKGSDTIVMAEHYGQAIDDMITIWNKEERKNTTIGYPQVQGTAEKSFRFARDSGTSMKQFLDRGRYLEDEIKRRAEKGSPHFFDKDTMRFFSSRVSELMWSEGELKDYQKSNIYFITSEADKGTFQHAGSARGFTVRIIDVDGDINVLGKFQGFSTLGEARRAIKDAIR